MSAPERDLSQPEHEPYNPVLNGPLAAWVDGPWVNSTSIESGPQSEAQWLDEAGAGMTDEEVVAWIETL